MRKDSMARILLAGTPKTTVQVAEKLVESGHEIITVLCPFPKPVGRKKILTPSELELWAKEHTVPVIHVNKDLLQEKNTLRNKLPQTDLLVVADFGFLVPAWLLNFPQHKALNLHPSLLPRWRGATPVPFTLLFGDKETGVTIIQMNEKFDQGGIVAQAPVKILSQDTTPLLLARAFDVGARVLLEILPSYISGNLKIVPQLATSPTPTSPRLSKEDGFVPFSTLFHVGKTEAPLLAKFGLETSAKTVERMVRALQPWPKVWTLLPNGKRMIVHQARMTSKGTLELEQVQLEGKTPVQFSEVKNQVM